MRGSPWSKTESVLCALVTLVRYDYESRCAVGINGEEFMMDDAQSLVYSFHSLPLFSSLCTTHPLSHTPIFPIVKSPLSLFVLGTSSLLLPLSFFSHNL